MKKHRSEYDDLLICVFGCQSLLSKSILLSILSISKSSQRMSSIKGDVLGGGNHSGGSVDHVV